MDESTEKFRFKIACIRNQNKARRHPKISGFSNISRRSPDLHFSGHTLSLNLYRESKKGEQKGSLFRSEVLIESLQKH